MADKLEHWIEWKQKCALDLCQPNTGDALKSVIWSLCDQLLGDGAQMPEKPWHEFEVHALPRGNCGGKPGKDFLFDFLEEGVAKGLNERQLLAGLRRGSRRLMRSALRKAGYMRRKGAPRRGEVSFDAPDDEWSALSENDREWLPSTRNPADDAAALELQGIALHRVDGIFHRINRHQQVAMASACLGVPLSNETVQQVAQRKKSVLCDAILQVEGIIQRDLARRYPSDDPETLSYLGNLVFQYLKVSCCKWAESERSCALLFHIHGYNEDHTHEC